MNAEYLSVNEYAELKGCSDRYIKKLIQDGKIDAKTTISEKNRPKYIIPVATLPEDLRDKYNRQRSKDLGLLPELKESEVQGDKGGKKKTEKAVNPRRLDSFTEDERRQIAFWTDTVKEWQSCRGRFKRKTDADEPFCGKVKLEHPDIKISPDILYKKYRAYLNNDLEGLVDNRGGWNRGQSSVDQQVFDIFTSYWLTENRLSVENCYGKTVAVVREYYPELAGSIPSSRTFAREIKRQLSAAVISCGRYGEKEFMDEYLHYGERGYEKLRPNDCWIGDNHRLDFFTMSDDGRIHRPYITTWEDAKSGIITAATLCDNPSADTTLLSLREGILSGYGLPASVYLDNGAEYTAGDVAGRGHRAKKNWLKEERPATILSILEIAVTNANVRNAKAKNIERFFCTFKEHYSKSMETYCGGKPDERPHDLDKLLKDGVIMTDEELRKIIPVFVKGYNSEKYGGKERRYKAKSRIQIWNEAVQNGEFEFRMSDAENLTLLMMRITGFQQIKRNGVYVMIGGKKVWFKDDNTVHHVGEEVYVRYDPSRLQHVDVYDRATDKFLYRYPNASELLDIDFLGAGEENIQRLVQSQTRTKKEVKKQLDSHRNFDAVSALRAEILRAEQNSEGYEIAKPDRFTPVMADALKPEGMEITSVQIADIRKITEFHEKMKGA